MGSDHHKKHKKDKKKKKRKHHDSQEEGVKEEVVKAEPQIELPQSNKDEAFVWKKKQEEVGLDQLDEGDRELFAQMKEKEKKIELWKVQRRREEREMEQAARAEELDRERLEKEREMFKEWQEQEGQFHLEQARLRSELRIKNNRANPIDLLAYYIHHANDSTATEIVGEPLSVVQNLSLQDLEDLQADIKVYKDLDKTKTEQIFWEALEVVCEDQIKQNKKKIKIEKNRSSINTAVGVDVTKIFTSKTSFQLAEMYKGIRTKLEKGGPIDVSYWENVSQQAFVEISKARLREKHEEITKRREFATKSKDASDGKSSDQLFPIDQPETEPATKVEEVEEFVKPAAKPLIDEEEKEEKVTKKKKRKKEEAQTMKIVKKDNKDELCMQEYEDLCYTPIRIDTIDMDALVYTDQKIQREIKELRVEVNLSRGISTTNSKTDSNRGVDLEEQAQALMGPATEDEELFNADIDIGKQNYSWADKYKPRKPRFYNRVHTGYEWNKYNQTHYDQDNPPPKIVQGYKFNIFYQDLIDPNLTPEYKLTVCKDEKEFCILKITAGPPYEAIAFKVLNKEWEYSNRYSFKSQYSQGIFQLWFQFKKYRYRR
ncbi:splicing factor Cactin-like [Bolinopsis microptera]|uniref:splicing factor Cactin-like n=1 Tax=Bolinopsis microptera TaxID=2820187 RepID=UPI003078AF4A